MITVYAAFLLLMVVTLVPLNPALAPPEPALAGSRAAGGRSRPTNNLQEGSNLHKVYINQLAAFLPNQAITNDQMEKVLGQIGPQPSKARRLILRSNRITGRHYAIDPDSGTISHSNAELTAAAIRRLDGPGCPLHELELLACGTTLPDQLMPNHALMVHGELKIPPCEVVATAGICLAGVMSLKYASSRHSHR